MQIFPRLRSMLGLILAGFALVALPLVAALVLAVINAEQLERQSSVLVQRAVELARISESLPEQLTDLERNARQYQVLGDEALLDVYRQRQARFLESLERLASLPALPHGAERIEALREGILAIGQALERYPPGSDKLARALEAFAELQAQAAALNQAAARFVDHELKRLSRRATEARRDLVATFILVIPVVIILAIIFVLLINRPVRQLERAIVRLGEDGFGEPIVVGGPPEIRALGEQLESLRQRLVALESEKSRFLRHMSHELKTPLASLREGTELLLDGSTGELNDTQHEVAGLLRANSLELQQTILNLLDFSAWQDKTHRLNITEFDLKAFAETLADRHRLLLAGRGITLEVAGPAVDVAADRDKLQTALDNLLSNAVKFSPDSGVIRIDVGSGPDGVTLELSDQGPGVPAADRKRIFEPFYQSDAPRASAVRGTGIGLSVVRECVNAHRGTIEVKESQQGACFRITLPFRDHA